MKKEAKRFFVLFFLGILFVSLIGGVFVSAALFENLTAGFDNTFSVSGWSGGAIPISVAKIFFFLLISLFTMIIMLQIFKSYKTISVLISFIIGFLATAYIAPREIFSILLSYTALGIAISSLVPLALLAALSYLAATADKAKVQLTMLQYFAWGIFGVYSLFRFVYDIFVGNEGSIVMNGILIFSTLAALIMIIFNTQLMRMIAHRYIASSAEAAKDAMDRGVTAVNIFAKAEADLAKGKTSKTP